MVVISEEVKLRLKKPLGRLYPDYSFLEELKGKRLISIGDASTLALLDHGIIPHLAVFDFRIKRKKISERQKEKLLSPFTIVRKYKNPKGTVSGRLLKNAKKLIREGGAVLIDGEEDLLALAFILNSSENDAVVYGQPDEGMVLVLPDSEIKNKIRKMLASSARTF